MKAPPSRNEEGRFAGGLRGMLQETNCEIQFSTSWRTLACWIFAIFGWAR